jgi:hypothetical protein
MLDVRFLPRVSLSARAAPRQQKKHDTIGQSLFDPPMPSKDYRIWLSDHAYLVVAFVMVKGEVVSFVVRLMLMQDGGAASQRRPIRYCRRRDAGAGPGHGERRQGLDLHGNHELPDGQQVMIEVTVTDRPGHNTTKTQAR